MEWEYLSSGLVIMWIGDYGHAFTKSGFWVFVGGVLAAIANSMSIINPPGQSTL
jgi:hypothetical protein